MSDWGLGRLSLRGRAYSAAALIWTVATLLSGAPAVADNWPSWRGPAGNGVAQPGNYPVRWSATEGIAWSLPLPGQGGSTPVVWGDHIYLTAPKAGQNTLICINRAGQLKWEVALGKEVAGKHKKGSGANPSAVTDGKLVFAYFKSGDLAAVSPTGEVVWHINLQEKYGADSLWWDLGTSPVLTDDAVVVTVMQTGPSYLVALKKDSGEVLWKQDRQVPAPEEAAQSYSTPIVTGQGAEQTIIVLGADHVTAHEAKTGKELWRVGGLNPTQHQYFRSIASPVMAGDLVIAPYARGETLSAIKMGGSGDVTKSHVAWHREGNYADVPTPAAAGDRVYLLHDKGHLACLNAKTGEPFWELELERNRNAYSASPILAGDHIYVTREDGKTLVIADRGRAGELVAANSLDEFVVATPVLVDGQMLLRTAEKLICIGPGENKGAQQ